LLTLALENQILNEAVSYLWDAYLRLEGNNIEGTRTSIRKSLETLLSDFVPKLTPVEEVERFPQKLKDLIKNFGN